MKFSPAVVLLAAALFALPVAAKDKPAPAVNADNKESFATVSSWVRKEMSDGGRYGDVSDKERQTVDARLTEMGQLLDKHGSVAEMQDADKTKMFNNQEEVNSILAKRDGDRMVCKSVAPVGSHIPVKTCKTARQIAQEKRDADTFLRSREQISQRQGGGG